VTLTRHSTRTDHGALGNAGRGVDARGVGEALHQGTRHWFDMGSRPCFTAIRFFREEDGWEADFTGDPIASRIPDLDALLAVTCWHSHARNR
jgi:hypothetical protein